MKLNKVHLHVPHPHHIRKAHYRRVVASMFLVITAVHFYFPDHEIWVSLLTNVLWLFDPTSSNPEA